MTPVCATVILYTLKSNKNKDFGAPGGNRTPDALLRTETLYPLSYRGMVARASDYTIWYNLSMSAKQHHERQFPGQADGEQVSFMFRQHPLVMRKQLIMGLFAILLMILPLIIPGIYAYDWLADGLTKLALFGPLLVLAYWFHRWVGWYYTVYLVTDRRIVEIKQKGFFDRTVQEWQLNKIYNVNYHVDGLEAVMFGYGDITAKTVIGEFVMPRIHRPTDIYHQLLEAVRSAGGGSQIAAGPVDQISA